MKMFYSPFIESVLPFSMICLFGNLSLKNRKKLEKTVELCGKITGATSNDLQHLHEVRVISKAQAVVLGSQHPVHVEFQMPPSGWRISLPKRCTNRYRLSFDPYAIGF